MKFIISIKKTFLLAILALAIITYTSADATALAIALG